MKRRCTYIGKISVHCSDKYKYNPKEIIFQLKEEKLPTEEIALNQHKTSIEMI